MLDTQIRTHPVLRAARAVTEAMREVAEAQPLYMSTEDKAAALVELTAAASLLGELRLRLLAVSDDVAETTGARDAAAWLAVTTRTRPEDARADLTLALALDRDHAPVAVALRESRVSLAQADVIVHALDALPRDLDPTPGPPARGPSSATPTTSAPATWPASVPGSCRSSPPTSPSRLKPAVSPPLKTPPESGPG